MMKRMMIATVALMATVSTGSAATNDVRTVHTQIAEILQSTNSVAAKARLLSPYVKIGDQKAVVIKRLGEDADKDGFGPGVERWFYIESGIHLTFDPDGECVLIETVDPKTHKYVVVAGVPEQSWPKKTKTDGQPQGGGYSPPAARPAQPTP